MRKVAVINQKGGVAKTTTTANVGAALAALGQRVLVVDLDPQANLTLGLRCDLTGLPYGLHDVLLNPFQRPISRIIRPVGETGLYLAPGHLAMSACETVLIRRGGPPFNLRDALLDSEITQRFDWVFFDCPPSLSALTQNAVVASTHLLVPTEPKMYAFAGMATLNQLVEELARNYSFQVELLGVLLTMYERGTKLHRTIAEVIREQFGDKVFQTVIYKNVRLSEAEVEGQPIVRFDRSARSAANYAALAEEILARVGESAK